MCDLADIPESSFAVFVMDCSTMLITATFATTDVLADLAQDVVIHPARSGGTLTDFFEPRVLNTRLASIHGTWRIGQRVFEPAAGCADLNVMEFLRELAE